MKCSSNRWISLCALASALLGSASAEARPTLDAFLERAHKQSFDTREADALAEQRSAEAGTTLGRLTPAFSARGVYTRNQDEVSVTLPGTTQELVITPVNQLDAYLQLDVPIIDLSSYYRYRSAKALARSASEQRSQTTIDVSRSVARSYFLLLGSEALADAAKQSVGLAEANLKNVENRRAVGAATELDRERARANLERAHQDQADAELGVLLTARGLETLSGVAPGAADAKLADDDLHAEAPLSRWIELSRSAPQRRISRAISEAASESKKAANSALVPTLAGVAQERFTNATGFSGRNDSYILQLVLSFRLDYGVLATNDAQAAAVAAQRVRLERSERALEDSVFEAFHRVEAGVVKSRAARAQSQAAGRAAELSTDRYGAGVATQLDVTQAQRDAFLAEASRIQADSDLAFARAALRLAAGQKVSP